MNQPNHRVSGQQGAGWVVGRTKKDELNTRREGGEDRAGVEGEILFREKWYGHYTGILDSGGNSIHAIGGRRDEDSVLARAAEGAQEEINAFIRAAGDEDVIFRDGIIGGEWGD